MLFEVKVDWILRQTADTLKGRNDFLQALFAICIMVLQTENIGKC